MSYLIAMGLFLLGVYLSIRTIATFYRVIDLWYTIRTAWAKVVREILGWGGGTVAFALLLPDRHRSAFLWGLAVYLAFYLAVYFVIWHLVVPRMVNRESG